jgi:drug/metabolite transporter (DMT)-like permease
MQANETKNSIDKRNLILMIAAFAAVYVIWGSTYLAIKYAIETLPSFLMAGIRFTVAGSILYGVARLMPDYEKPKAVHWRTSFIMGALLLAVGNGGVVIAEHYISSSLAALLVATLPFWMVLLGWLFMGYGRPNYRVAIGLLVGFVGVALLISGNSSTVSAIGNSGSQFFGVICIMVATLGWAIGSLYGTRASAVKSTALAAGMQMLAGGFILILMGTVTGEWTAFDISAVSTNSWLALVYLIVFGAIIAFTAYSWLLKNVSPAAISTYAYVNPVIAVFLGWAIAGESMTVQMLAGAAVIVGSVALISSEKKKAGHPKEKLDASASSVAKKPRYST